MPHHPAHRLLQLGARSLGFDPGPIDGWWGPKTDTALTALATSGPLKSSGWAVLTLERGLHDLGWLPSTPDGSWTAATRIALQRAADADGAAAAAYSARPDEILTPYKPALRPVDHGNVLRQGSAGTVITGFCLHCAAVPGSWAVGKTNEEIVAAVRRMHTDPKSQGGRGWSDIGYTSVGCPDGEVLDGRPSSRIPAGAIGYNAGWWHHLMIEVRTINRTRRPEDYFTAETLAAGKAQIAAVAARTPIKRLMGHNEVAAKLCPGFDVVDREWTDLAVA
ncbi:hypothetical protein [Jannaschia formosa]|uniref:hypothetical protein n=1 Tax=Jannaschia formosa TaxID=2259592 RepID=UPI000E1C38BD|nr:hypothetical protein [Jannaschia formosa]TFL16446.1 hypothetical protein DR046_20205 [Jannaschia formosa]